MRFIENIKNKLAELELQKNFEEERQVVTKGLGKAESVGIIYLLDSENTRKIIKKYIDHLKKNFGVKEIKALGYINEKEVPSDYSPLLHYDYFSNKELNWRNLPNNHDVDNFINTRFDILIDLTEGDIIPVKYVVLRSIAGMKAGMYSEKNKGVYDVMIKVPGIRNLKEYIEQVDLYLEMIDS